MNILFAVRPSVTVLVLSSALAGACATSSSATGGGPPAREAAPASRLADALAPSPRVATVDGRAITREELDAHAAATKLPADQALDDLIDLVFLRAACRAAGIALPADHPAPDARAAAELALARKLSLDVPPDRDVLLVDHAWVKDAAKKAVTAKQKKSLEELRARVVAGQTIPKAFETLKGVDGNAWHIGDHEEYPTDVVPAQARDLAPGSVSPVVPGDGGLHLFKIHERKTMPPPADAVHDVVRERLLEGKTIEQRVGVSSH